MEANTVPKRKTSRRRGFAALVWSAIVLGLVAWLLLPASLGEQARRMIQLQLQTHYSHLRVTIREGTYEPGRGLLLRGIEFQDPQRSSLDATLVKIDELLIETSLNLEKLRHGSAPLEAQRVFVRGATANLWLDASSRWSLETLLPLPKFGPGCSSIHGDNIRVRLCRTGTRMEPALELNQVLFTVHQSIAANQVIHRRVVVQGGGGFLESFQAVATMDHENLWHLEGMVKRLQVDAATTHRLPSKLAEAIEPWSGLSAIADVRGSLTGTKDAGLRDWHAEVFVHNGRYATHQLPKSIEKFKGKLIANPTGVALVDGRFCIDGSNCLASGQLHGLKWPAPLSLEISADDLLLDSSLLAILPDQGKSLYQSVSPIGLVDLSGRFHFDGFHWTTAAEVLCHGLEANLEKFPYPLRDVRGRIRVEDGVLATDLLTARAGAARLQTSFQLSPKNSSSPHWIEIQADARVPIDERLLTALTPRGLETSKVESFVRSLQPGGSIHLHRARFDRDAEGILQRSIELEIADGRMRYDRFSFPLHDARGHLTIDNRSVRLVQFQAHSNGGAAVHCNGHWLAAAGENPAQLDLTFQGFDIPLDEGLRAALPTNARQTWDLLVPSGILQNVHVHLLHQPERGRPELKIIAQQGAGSSGPRREVSLTPISFPYRLDITRGIVQMVGDQITIGDLDGAHGSSRLTAEGQCRKREDGRWQLDLTLLTGSRIRPDQDLISALPADIRGGFTKLQLREPVGLRGTTQLIFPNLENPQPIISWDVLLQLEGNRITDSGPVHNLRGEILVRGAASGDRAAAEGNVVIDSMHVDDLQITNVRGPFTIRGPNLILGSRSTNSSTPVSIVGKMFDGLVQLSGDVMLTNGRFDVLLQLSEGNVATLLTELKQNQAGIRGNFAGSARLEGNLGELGLLRGMGSARLSQANLYQLPLLVQIFSQLSLTPGEDAAFTDGTTKFSVDGNLLTLSDLQLWGNVVAIHGGGTITGRREIDLAFNTRVSPQNTWSKLMLPLRNQPYTLWTIYVHGPLHTPQIERRALEAVGVTLERLFPVMDRAASAIPTTPISLLE